MSIEAKAGLVHPLSCPSSIALAIEEVRMKCKGGGVTPPGPHQRCGVPNNHQQCGVNVQGWVLTLHSRKPLLYTRSDSCLDSRVMPVSLGHLNANGGRAAWLRLTSAVGGGRHNVQHGIDIEAATSGGLETE